MNAENYPLFLRRPERLWQLNGHELRSLVLEYPYSANLRLLLAQKAQMEAWPDAEALLAMAATYHSDRKQLHWQMRLLPSERPEDAPQTIEEVLELKPLDEALPDVPAPHLLEEVPPTAAEPRRRALIIPGASFEQPVEPEPEEADELVWPVALPDEELVESTDIAGEGWSDRLQTAVAVAIALPLDQAVAPAKEAIPSPVMQPFRAATELVADVAGAVGAVTVLADYWIKKSPLAALVIPEAAVTPPPFRLDTTLVKNVAAAVATAATIEVATTAEESSISPREVVAPLPVETLPSYREQYRPARLSTLSELLKEKADTAKPARKKKAKKSKAKRRKPKTSAIAARSLQADEELGSETLAQLLERQGHYERALAMYERLRLSDPEKSGFFAARIRELQARIDDLPPA